MRRPFVDWRNAQETPLLVMPLPWKRRRWLIVYLRWPVEAVVV